MIDTTPNLHSRELLSEFSEVLGLAFDAPPDLMLAVDAAIIDCRAWPIHQKSERTRRLFAIINSKLKLNKDRIQDCLDFAAKNKIFLNYHDKMELAECFDSCDRARLDRWLAEAGHNPRLSVLFNPISEKESLAGLHELLSTGKVNRSDARQCDLLERQTDILSSLFGSYVFNSFPSRAMHAHFNADAKANYHPDFYRHLLEFHPTALHRDCALIYLSVDQNVLNKLSQEQLRDALYAFIAKAYERLANHCFLAIKIKPFREREEDRQWQLFADLVLYAEKHREVQLQTGYFHPGDIEAATLAHIPDLQPEDARFDLANEGFFFRDCFVLSPNTAQQARGHAKTSNDVDLLLLFEKNERDERLIPCPACRSFNIRGNSYPALGVRS